MRIIDVAPGTRREVPLTIGGHSGYSVLLRDYKGFPSWVQISSDLPRGVRVELSPDWFETKRRGKDAVRTLVFRLPDDHALAPGATAELHWRIRAAPKPEDAPETPQKAPQAERAAKLGKYATPPQNSSQGDSESSHGGLSPRIGGWRVENVSVEEHAPWRNRMVIDIACDASGLRDGRGYGMNAMLARPVDRGYEVVPTVVGYASGLKLDQNDPEDRDIELILRDVPLFWGEKHELHLSVRGERTHHTLPFVLDQSMKATDMPGVRNLEARNVMRIDRTELRPEITGKCKLVFQYDFAGEDAWFYLSASEALIWRSERMCKKNDEGRCAFAVYLKHGNNKVTVTPYDPKTKATGRSVSIEVVNPF